MRDSYDRADAKNMAEGCFKDPSLGTDNSDDEPSAIFSKATFAGQCGDEYIDRLTMEDGSGWFDGDSPTQEPQKRKRGRPAKATDSVAVGVVEIKEKIDIPVAISYKKVNKGYQKLHDARGKFKSPGLEPKGQPVGLRFPMSVDTLLRSHFLDDKAQIVEYIVHAVREQLKRDGVV